MVHSWSILPPRLAHAIGQTSSHTHLPMLGWSITFLIIALIAGLLGFTGAAGTFAELAKIFFYIFLVLLVVSALVSALRGKPPV